MREMNKETLEKYANKKVKVVLCSNNVYTLTIHSVSDSSIVAIDKYQKRICIDNANIAVIEEDEGNGYEKNR
jgi:small nuclear ribonucleoprotein (snRNP)-like protein